MIRREHISRTFNRMIYVMDKNWKKSTRRIDSSSSLEHAQKRRPHVGTTNSYALIRDAIGLNTASNNLGSNVVFPTEYVEGRLRELEYQRRRCEAVRTESKPRNTVSNLLISIRSQLRRLTKAWRKKKLLPAFIS